MGRPVDSRPDGADRETAFSPRARCRCERVSPIAHLLRRAWPRGCAVLLTILVLAVTGCGTAPQTTQAASKREAVVVLRNISPHRWKVTFRPVMQVVPVVVQVAPQATDELSLAGGEYQIEQAIDDGGPERPPPRTFSLRLESGERYRWVLSTLLTADGVERVGL